jgi:glycosyltransferase involved in cell wall biosynthesis
MAVDMSLNVTIGLPFFNAERDLPDAIRSVFAQTYQDWELILVDDGSTDGSLEIARSIDDPRVRVVSDGRNLRLASRLNQIVEMARCDFIARMDADDLMPPERIARELAVLEAEPDVDLVSSGLISLDEQDRPVGARWHIDTTVTRDHLLHKTGAGIVHAAVLGRRAWFQRNPYDPSVPIAQDYDLWLRSSKRNDLHVRTLQEPLYYVRELGSVSEAKMLRSYRMDRRALWHNRCSLWEARFIAKSFAKTVVLHLIFSTVGLDWLVRRRNRQTIDAALVEKFYVDLELIRSTHVPGL